MSRLQFIPLLQSGETVRIRCNGNSMVPVMNKGDLAVIAPVDITTLKKDDAVFCKVNGSLTIHKISAIRNNQFQISNNAGYINGWIKSDKIYGKLIGVEKRHG